MCQKVSQYFFSDISKFSFSFCSLDFLSEIHPHFQQIFRFGCIQQKCVNSALLEILFYFFKPPSRLRNWQKSLKKSGHFIIKKPPKNVSKSSKWPHSIDSGHTAIKTDASSSMMTLKSRRFSLQARAKFSRFGCRAHVRSLASAFRTTGYNWIQLTHIGPDKKEQGWFKTTFMDMVVFALF